MILNKLKLSYNIHTMLALTGIIAIIMFWIMLQTFFNPAPFLTESTVLSERFTEPPTNAQLDAMINQHLFGADLSKNQIKETSLPLTLVGVSVDTDPKQSHAVIADANGRQAVYVIGAHLPGAAQLKAIETQRILLEHHGRLEALSLPHDMLHFEPPPQGLYRE